MKKFRTIQKYCKICQKELGWTNEHKNYVYWKGQYYCDYCFIYNE